jgi:hypothetical protein
LYANSIFVYNQTRLFESSVGLCGRIRMRGEDSIAELCRREPRKIYSLLKVVNPGGSEEELQLMLKKMREEDLVKFDIYKGPWSRA